MGDLTSGKGGSIITGASLIALTMINPAAGFAAAGAIYGVRAQRKAAGAQQVEMELAQRQEETAARDREIQRRRRFNAILGAQSAAAGAGGIAMSGSVANISITDASRAAEESAIDRNTTGMRIDALGRRSRSIGAMSRARTATTILGTIESQL